MFAYSFLAMTSYNIVKPLTRSTFIASLGSDNLPYVQFAAALLIGVMMDLYVRLGTRLPRRALIPVTQGILVVVLLTFWVLFQGTAVWVPAVFYLFGLLFGILIISQFWTLANEIYDPRQARRIFGFIGGGSALGGMLGNGILSLGTTTIGTTNLLIVSASVLALCLAIVSSITRRQPLPDDSAAFEAEKGVGGGEAIRLLRQSRHLQVIALVIGFAAIGAVTIEQQLNMATEASGENLDQMTQFLGQVGFWVSLVAFLIQIGLTSRIHRSMGLTFALLLLPVSLGASAVVILLSALRWAPAAARVLDSAMRYSIDKTTREVLFLPLPSDLRNRAKPFVDVTVDRFAKGLGSIALLVLIKPWGLGLDWVQLSYFSLAMMSLWVGFAIVARREYLRTFRKSLDSRNITPEAVRLNVADPATIEALVEGLASPDEMAVLYAIEMLETLDKRHLITPLLLHHDTARVRARALAALAAAGPERGRPWLPMVERMVKDEEPGVRAAAVRTLASLQGEEASTLLHRFLEDHEPRVIVTAAAELADSGQPADALAAEAALVRLVDDTRSSAADGRREAAAALARVRNPAFRSLLVQLIHDPDVTVASEAIASAKALGPSDALFMPALVSLLGDRLLKAAARDTLVSYGEDVIAFLAHVMADPEEHLWIRRHVPATLARIPTQRSMDALVAAAGTTDGFLRFKIISAIESLRRDHPGLTFPASAVEHMVVRETSRYYTYLTLRHNIVTYDPTAEGSLLVAALDDKLTRTLDRVFRLLGLLYSLKDIAAARYALERGDARRRSSSLEYLDNTLGGIVRKRVMPILDDAPLADKLRHAYNILKSRPRDVVDTLAQLVHEDDRVIAAAAILFAGQQRLQASLADDFAYVLGHQADDAALQGAVSWALRAGSDEHAGTADALPDVELADRLRAIPLFGFVSVDELFRVAAVARQVRFDPGDALYREDEVAEDVLFVLDGRVEVWGEGQTPMPVLAPTVLNVADVLEGRALSQSVSATRPTVGLALEAGDFLTMLTDSPLTAQGLFRMLLGPPSGPDVFIGHRPSTSAAGSPRRADRSDPMERAILLRESPLLARATLEQLRELVEVTGEIDLPAGTVIFEPGSPAAIYYVLTGGVRIDDGSGASTLVGSGGSIGVAGALTRSPTSCRATAVEDVRAFHIDPDDLFDVLSNHSDLLQGVFSGVLSGASPTGGRQQAKEGDS
jgi:AAA family ATP:ADP antiporter